MTVWDTKAGDDERDCGCMAGRFSMFLLDDVWGSSICGKLLEIKRKTRVFILLLSCFAIIAVLSFVNYLRFLLARTI